MVEEVTQTDVFRFVAIRNPTRPDKNSLSFLRMPAVVADTGFIQSLIGIWKDDGSEDLIQRAVKEYQDSANYLISTVNGKLRELLLDLASAFREFGESGADFDFDTLLEQDPAIATLLRTKDSLLEIEGKVWHSFVAALLWEPTDRQVIVDLGDCVRVITYISGEFDEENSLAVLDDLMQAEIVIPENLIGPPKEWHLKEEEKRIAPFKDSSKQAYDAFKDKVDRVAQLSKAADYLEFANITERTTLVAQEAEVDPPPADGEDVFFGTPAVSVNFVPEIWDAIEENFPQVRGLLEEAGLSRESFHADRAEEIIRKVLLAEHSQLPLVQTLFDQESVLRDPLTGRSLAIDPEGLQEQDPPLGYGKTRILGLGDLKVVRRRTLKYAKGELAHIENVLAGEEKSRTHSRTERTEDYLEVEEETSTESERDTQTTERFELTDEASKTVQKDSKAEAGVTVTAKYGPVSISANAGFNSSRSQTQIKRQARNYARDVVERSVERISKRVRQKRTRTTIHEVQEINVHRLVAPEDSHTIGVYRWVDKWYQAQVYNYGLRQMLEFILPEPAAMYRYSHSDNHSSAPVQAKPLPPTINGQPLNAPDQITQYNYGALLNLYGSIGSVDPPPESRIVLSKAYVQAGEKAESHGDISVPEGYEATSAIVYQFEGVFAGRHTRGAQVGFGDKVAKLDGTRPKYQTLNRITEVVPVSILSFGYKQISFHVTVICSRQTSKYQAWQHSVFDAVMEAYSRKMDQYEGTEVSKGIQIQGQAPDANREIEKNELKRMCIEFLRRKMTNFGSMIEPLSGLPYMDFSKAFEEGAVAQFFEQAFEWEQITYLFYPYMWAKRSRWANMLTQTDADPLFRRFLAAGSARVVAPVRPGYEKALMYFLKTGKIWDESGEIPTIEDPLYESIVNALKEQEDAPDEGLPEGAPWEVKLPTSLVMLDDDAGLPDWSDAIDPDYIPSDEDCFGEHYNKKLWADDGVAIHREYLLLGYKMPSTGNPLADMASPKGRQLIRAFQARIKKLIPNLSVVETEENDVCTLVALTHAHRRRTVGAWPGPGPTLP